MHPIGRKCVNLIDQNRIEVFLLANDYCVNAKLRHWLVNRQKIWRRRAQVGHLLDRKFLFPRSSMSQNRGFTRGFVAIERFLILMIYSKKSGPNDCVVIRRLSLFRGVAIGRFHCNSYPNLTLPHRYEI